MPKIGLVTDSTCDLLPSELSAMDVRMVPLKVLFGDETYLDWVELAPEEFYAKLEAASTLPKTSQPSPAEFLDAYTALAEEGCEGIVSIHLSAALSGTYESAMLACADSPIPVHVIDSKTVCQALALVVRRAVEARDAGLSLDDVASKAQEVADSMRIYFVLDTLDYLVKGGRAGKAQGLAAALLNIKPVLTINDEGIVEPFKKVKGRNKAISEIVAHVVEDARANGPMVATVLHGCSPEIAETIKADLLAADAGIEVESIGLVGSVIGTYTGQGAIGVAYYPKS